MQNKLIENENDSLKHDNFLTAKERKKLENSRKNKEAKIARSRERTGNPELNAVTRSPIGTPQGNKQRMQEFKNKLLTEVNGNAIIAKMLQIALDDEHPGQATALKMCADRILPSSLFEDKKDGSRTAINITISGIGDTVVGEVIENED